jgi:hypothetical protein
MRYLCLINYFQLFISSFLKDKVVGERSVSEIK